VMQRWRTERVYEDLKGELGLDHFEGRRFPGWHHHISVALCCYAFVIAERVRRFSPRPEGRWNTVRTPSRPERRFSDSFIPPGSRSPVSSPGGFRAARPATMPAPMVTSTPSRPLAELTQ